MYQVECHHSFQACLLLTLSHYHIISVHIHKTNKKNSTKHNDSEQSEITMHDAMCACTMYYTTEHEIEIRDIIMHLSISICVESRVRECSLAT